MRWQSEHALVEREIEPFLLGNRMASAALLAWFLHAVWRVEPEDIDDAICDGRGDKGIDGLLVDDDLREITVFQSKHRQNPGSDQGDARLKQLVGAGAYFESAESVDRLMRSSPNPELSRLLARLRIRERVADGAHAARLVFVTNGVLDPAGRDYLQAMASHDPQLEVWDLERLGPAAQRTRRPELLAHDVILTAAARPTAADLDDDVRIAVALVPATQLVLLPGIDDLSLFARNVRLSEGRTRINRELRETVNDRSEHKLFAAYHNGLTLLTHRLVVEGDQLHLTGIAVVNGCQSLLSFRDRRNVVSEDLKVLVKVVQISEPSSFTDKITYRTNNQNPVDIRDQRSTDRIQRDLQQQVSAAFPEELAYGIREGETFAAPEVLDNREAAQLLMAVYLGEPWNAVRKVRLFDQDYHRIFSREVDAQRLYFIHLLSKVVSSMRPKLRLDLAASFASVRFSLAYLLADVLRSSDRGEALLETPGQWLPELRDAVVQAMTALAEEVVDSINFFVDSEREDKGEAFDPKVVFKSHEGVRELENVVVRDSRRQARRDESYLFNLDPKDIA